MNNINQAASVWTPTDKLRWNTQAYGRNVFYTSQSGALIAHLPAGFDEPDLYLHGFVIGRMLVEAYVDQAQIYSELVSNRSLTLPFQLSAENMKQGAKLRIHFIPATWGEIACARKIDVSPEADYKFEVFNSMQVA